MNILSNIVEWASGLPGWQSDALRRFMMQGVITEREVNIILRMLKAEHGILDPKNPPETPVPLTSNVVAVPSKEGSKIILKSLRDVQNVNALAPGQTIKFAEQGLTVIYGDNATGKSGYSRVMKKACKAREKEDILPNVFKQDITSDAQAIFDISINGKDEEVTWINDKQTHDSLGEIAVFDSKCARVYVNKANKVEYIPYGLDAITNLASLIQELQSRLQSELSAVSLPPEILNEIDPTTTAGTFVNSLSHKTNIEELNNLASYSEENNRRHKELSSAVAQAKSQDAKAKATALRIQKERIDQLICTINNINTNLSHEKLMAIYNSHKEAQATEKTAKLASQETFKHEPLQGVGSNEWKYLFEAARKYSEIYAYSTQQFPVTEQGSRCVLCQQELQDEAPNRMQRFWKFIHQDTEKLASTKRKSYEQSIKSIELLSLHFDPTIVEEIRTDVAETATMIESWLQSAKIRVVKIKESCESGQAWDTIPHLLPNPSEALTKMSTAKEKMAIVLDKAAEKTNLLKLETELKELQARSQLYKYKNYIIDHIKQLQHYHRLTVCKESLSTRSITEKNKELTLQVITETLRKALEAELKNLNANHLHVSLSSSGRTGITFHQIQLKDCNFRNIEPSSILSEGEQRILSIASFLAELQVSKHTAPIVFDDPISSLDHIWRERVAQRLVEEGNKRQIIIFIHDLVFLLALLEEATKQRVPLIYHSVRRKLNSTEVGICELGKLPWEAMSVNGRINDIKQLWQKLNKFYEDDDVDNYQVYGQHCFDRIRETWERVVEELLFYNVVQRFRPSVMTQNLRYVEIKEDDFIKIDRSMTKCSVWMHDRAAAKNQPFPTPSSIWKSIEEIESYSEDIRMRLKTVEKERKKLSKPPTPTA